MGSGNSFASLTVWAINPSEYFFNGLSNISSF